MTHNPEQPTLDEGTLDTNPYCDDCGKPEGKLSPYDEPGHYTVRLCDGCLRQRERETAEQVALDTEGEWELHNDGSVRICVALGNGSCKQIAEAEIIGWTREESLQHAAQIVADHKAAKSQALLVEAATNALKSFRYMRDVDPQHWDFHVTLEVCTAWDKLRAALKAAGVEGDSK